MFKSTLLILGTLLLVGSGCASSSSSDIQDVRSFEHEDGTQGVVTHYNDGSADLSLTFFLADDEEYLDFLGEPVPIAPSFINVSCQLYQQYIYNQSEFLTLIEEQELEVDLEAMESLDELLGGRTVRGIHLMFEDQEDGELIGECIANSAEFDDIIFSGYREYPASEFTNTQIGDRAF